MSSNRIAFAAVSLACVAAAAGGSYLATRQNQASSAMAAPATVAPPVAPAPAQASAAATSASVESAAPGAQLPSTERDALEPPRAAAPAAVPEKRSNKAPATVVARSAPATAAPFVTAQSPLTPLLPEPAAVPTPDAPARQDDVRAPEPPKTIEPERAPEKTFDELVVSADSVIGLQIETPLSSERAKVEDRVEARVIRDVRVGSHVAIPSGARAVGTVTVVERGGKLKDRARLGIRFNTLVLADGTRIPVSTEVIYRYGEAPATAQKVGGGAVIGTILGGLLGGAKGAAIGAAAGAGGGAAAQAAGDRNAAEFPAGMQMTARFLAPVTVTVEH